MQTDFAVMVSYSELSVAFFVLSTYTYKKSRVLVGSGVTIEFSLFLTILIPKY